MMLREKERDKALERARVPTPVLKQRGLIYWLQILIALQSRLTSFRTPA